MKLVLLLACSFVCFELICLNHPVSCLITIFDQRNTTILTIDDLGATFGPRIPEVGFTGYIAITDPEGACTKVEKPPSDVSYVDPKEWIALILRTPSAYGNCSFDLKVFNAQNAGFKAVIIYNSESDDLIRMSSGGYFNIKIPSVFIGHSSGLDIINFFTYKNKTYVTISNDDADLRYLLIPFVCVVSVCFIIAITIFIVKFGMHFYKLRKNRFPKSALKKIPTKKYQKTDKYDTCPICLNEYEEGVKIRILPCEHAYHIECIDKWLLRNNRFCPVCKRRVLPGGSDSDSEESTENTTSTVTLNRRNSGNENQPNEDDDTNEHSRLLINVRSGNNDNIIVDDNLSSATISTTLNHTNSISNMQNVNVRGDISSMNNQMTTSTTSANFQNKDLRSSSSRYGSISSVNLVASNSANQNLNQESQLINEQEQQSTTDFLNKEDSIQNENLSLINKNEEEDIIEVKKTKSKKNKKAKLDMPINKQNLNKITSKIVDSDSVLIPNNEEGIVNIENELVESARSSKETTKSNKKKLSKKKSAIHPEKSSDNKNNENHQDDDENSKLI